MFYGQYPLPRIKYIQWTSWCDFCKGNGLESVRVYRDRFPNRKVLNHQTFANIEMRFRENAVFESRNINRGRTHTTRTV